MIDLYELAGKDNVIFSPYCWRVRLALLHKKIDFRTIETAFTEIKEIDDGQFKTLPILSNKEEEKGIVINDSFKIAEYLEDKYPMSPSLFYCDESRSFARFVESWSNSLHMDIAKMDVSDIYSHLFDKDKEYFRVSREKFLGDSLESVQLNNYESSKANLITKLKVLEHFLVAAEFISGKAAGYCDFIVFGTLKWLMVTSHTFKTSDLSPAVEKWFLEIEKIYCDL